MLRLNVEAMQRAVREFDGIQSVGRLHSARGVLTAELPAAINELCEVELPTGAALAEVVGFHGRHAMIMPLESIDGLTPGARITALGRPLRIPCGDGVAGRVIDGLGTPLDAHGPLRDCVWRAPTHVVPAALDRPRIAAPLVTGQRVVDSLLTLGRGQRVGLFAGGGVGKSTLLGEIARGANADRTVIGLIGERGREVRPFLEDCLGPEGLARSTVVVSTSDQPALLRIRAAQTAIAIADHFRRQGEHVLLLLDSLTRLATAQREIGLLQDEPPSSRGYTPSVFQLLARTLEQLGADGQGAITGILTVLVDGDDLDEPVSDAVRAIVDGHIVLSRQLAELGHYPAIDVARSISRVFPDVVTEGHAEAARRVRSMMSVFAKSEDLIRVGAYRRGADADLDRAVDLMPQIREFLTQRHNQPSEWDDTCRKLAELARRAGGAS